MSESRLLFLHRKNILNFAMCDSISPHCYKLLKKTAIKKMPKVLALINKMDIPQELYFLICRDILSNVTSPDLRGCFRNMDTKNTG